MFPTVFHVPEQVAGVPLFGAGLLLVVWAVASVALLAWLVRRQGWCADTLGYVPLLLLLGALIRWILPLISEPGLGLPIRSYGVMLFFAVFAGTSLTIWRGGRLGLDADRVLTLTICGFIPGILVARLFYVVRFWSEFPRPTVGATLVEIINITQGGLIVYGALIGGLLGFGALIVRQKLPALATLDLLVPGMLLGLALGRIGCFLFGCCYGGPSSLPWAVRFPLGSPPFLQEVHQGEIFLYGLKFLGEPGDPPVIAEVEPGSEAERQGLRAGMRVRAIGGYAVLSVNHARTELLRAHRLEPQEVTLATAQLAEVARLSIPSALPRSRPLHPTQLYSAIDAAILCLFLLAYDPFRRRDGELFALLLTIYPINRFLTEFIRTDDPGVWGTWLTLGQAFSLVFLVVAAGLWWHILRRPPGKAFFPPLTTGGSRL